MLNSTKGFQIRKSSSQKKLNCNYIMNSDNRRQAVWTIVSSEFGLRKRRTSFGGNDYKKKEISSGLEIAHIFNAKFSDVAKDDTISFDTIKAVENNNNLKLNSNQTLFNFEPISKERIAKVIQSMKNKMTARW